MASQGPVEQTLRVFETIDTHFKANPALLNTDGIFRISSAGRKHIDLAESLQNSNSIDWSQFSAHDCANALKYALLQVRLLPAQDERVQLFMDLIEDPKHHQKAFSSLISSLNCTESEGQIAKIINIAMDICRRTTIQQKYNRMSPTNLSVVWGPSIQHCLNMEPKGDDLSSQVMFTMNRLNPAIEECISKDLPKVVPVVVDLKRKALSDAGELYENAKKMLEIASMKMTAIKQAHMELLKILAVKESLLKKGGLSRQEKKELKNDEIPKYKADAKNLDKQLQNWKVEAKRHLDVVANYEERAKLMTCSIDRLSTMLSEMTVSSSDEEINRDPNMDELLNNSPVMIVQYEEMDAEDNHAALEQAPKSAKRARLDSL